MTAETLTLKEPKYLTQEEYQATSKGTLEEFLASREDRIYTDRVNAALTVKAFAEEGKQVLPWLQPQADLDAYQSLGWCIGTLEIPAVTEEWEGQTFQAWVPDEGGIHHLEELPYPPNRLVYRLCGNDVREGSILCERHWQNYQDRGRARPCDLTYYGGDTDRRSPELAKAILKGEAEMPTSWINEPALPVLDKEGNALTEVQRSPLTQRKYSPLIPHPVRVEILSNL